MRSVLPEVEVILMCAMDRFMPRLELRVQINQQAVQIILQTVAEAC